MFRPSFVTFQPPRDKLMPVMFWIHGGKHYQGSSTSLKYGADFLITEDVVLVTFNYRLGVFGKLHLYYLLLIMSK